MLIVNMPTCSLSVLAQCVSMLAFTKKGLKTTFSWGRFCSIYTRVVRFEGEFLDKFWPHYCATSNLKENSGAFRCYSFKSSQNKSFLQKVLNINSTSLYNVTWLCKSKQQWLGFYFFLSITKHTNVNISVCWHGGSAYSDIAVCFWLSNT